MLNNIRSSIDKVVARQRLVNSYWNESINNDVIGFYTRVVASMGDAERCSIFIHNPENETLWVQSGTGVDKHQIEVPTEGSMVGKVIKILVFLQPYPPERVPSAADRYFCSS